MTTRNVVVPGPATLRPDASSAVTLHVRVRAGLAAARTTSGSATVEDDVVARQISVPSTSSTLTSYSVAPLTLCQRSSVGDDISTATGAIH